MPVEEAARQIKADGFCNVVCDFAFADVHFNPLEPDWAAARKVVSTLERAGVEIVSLFGYYNIVDPDVRGESWARPGSRRCSASGTGWAAAWYRPRRARSIRNRNGRALRRTRPSKAIFSARPCSRSTPALLRNTTPWWRSRLTTGTSSVRSTVPSRLFREVKSPALRLVMDPCNYFRKEDLPRMKPMLEAMFQKLGEQIVIAHAKDVKASAEAEDLPAAGLGVLDYPLFLRLLARLDRPLPVVVEHLRRPDVARTRDFVLGNFDKI